ncbi:uncharacterized protein LOC111485602 isoform X1 [Cucurbita maxima]|uniref:Uncharacterized protein LOC111485602 isoform X1 n=1 Tax=Cucurbita maxima TaxID=3661 RepID=A0A6J1JCQ9_CUCMA|nr:uncharacterized protein LOC111485602 isoform X1 [Cucurbita maxima]
MGRKKKNIDPRSKQSPSVRGVAVDAPSLPNAADKSSIPDKASSNNQSRIESVSVNESDGFSYSTIKLECERALNVLRRGNHSKALRLMKELNSKINNSVHSALIHRVQGTICVKLASVIEDVNTKQRHLKNAIESARKAVELSPNSIEFSHFYANLLYEGANDAREYEEVVQECERALGIENPIDPAKESLQDEKDQKIPTPEARITHVQTELRHLVQKSNIYSISSWMKNLGNGEEKFRLIPIRKVTEDPMEATLVQAKRANEIKKATKTPEERRKEIEVRVAAARLLQQKFESPQMQNEGGKADRTLDSSSGSSTKVGERRKHANVRKHGSSRESRDWVYSFWNSKSTESKKELLKIKISDLKTHFSSSKDTLANEVISEAVSFYDANKTWNFLVCCKCDEKFVYPESHMHHVLQEHMGNLLPKMQSIMPQNVDNDWSQMLLNCSWKPFDVSAAAKILIGQTKCNDSELVKDIGLQHHSECEESLKDACDSSPEKHNHGHGLNEFKLYEKISNSGFALSDSFPVSDDSERTRLLEKIHAVFELLIGHKCLAASHLNKVIQFAMDELQGIVSGSHFLKRGLDQTPLCICFLGASQLGKILKFLQELSQSCGIGRYSDKSTGQVEDPESDKQAVDVKEKVVLNGDASLLLLNECFLSSDIPHANDQVAATDHMPAATVKDATANEVLSDVDSFLSWIYADPSNGEQVASWTKTKEEKTKQQLEIFQMLEKEFYLLQNLCERKCEHLNYEEALQSVEDLFFEESKKEEATAEFIPKSYVSVLRKRREELLETENNVMYIGSRFELDVVTNILKEAEALKVNQFGYEETVANVPSQSCDLESGEDENWRAKGYLHQVDTCIEIAIKRQKEQLSIEVSKIDARIMRNVSGMQQMELKLEPVSAHDYQSILLPLVNSYLRAYLEDLAEKDATKKSDAAREAFLAELALDSEKGIKGGSDNSRHAHEKPKEKKRSKEFRKSKDSKVVSGPEQNVLHDGAVDGVPVQVSPDGDVAKVDVAAFENSDALRLQEEGLRRKIELEADERRLEEALEYQRRVENEAKQKLLAELQKKSAQTNLEDKVALAEHDNPIELVPSVEGAEEHFKPTVVDQLAESESIPGLSRNFPAMPNAVSGSYNAGIVENTPPPSDRKKGRKGRRHKVAIKRVDGNQPSQSYNDNVAFDNQLNEQVRDHDNLVVDSVNPLSEENGTKTLGQQHAEDDEERFQADLKKAVRQSLDAFQEQQELPLITSSSTPSISCGEVDGNDLPSNELNVENVQEEDVFGTGLKNEVGEYNCFLNVIIQSLWHLRRFREEFLRRSTTEHVHVGDPCVLCALYEILAALSTASADARREAVAPTSLRIALSNFCPDSNFFQEGQMNDASEVLAVIFDCLHKSLTRSSSVSDTESVESNCMGSWDCASDTCLVHSIFGMDIFERMNCYSCGLESRHLKYTSFFHNINAHALRTMKVMCTESSFDELLNVVEMNHQLACDLDVGGCGKLNYIHRFLSAAPHVFTTVLGWQNTCESADDITATLAALNTEVDISVLYRGLDPNITHNLVSVVCYYGQHYHCFAYSHDKKCWIMYDDKTVKVIGGWPDVLTMCEKGHLQPQVLFFEAVN